MENNMKELSLEELNSISSGYIVKDSDGYHVIHDTDGYEIATFQEDQYDFMMMLITKKWKNSPDFITWEKAEEIRQKHMEEWYSQHPEFDRR